jgi:hypothetical protein
MEITIKIPDETIEDIKDRLQPLLKMGALHAVATDALLGTFHTIRTQMKAEADALLEHPGQLT